MARVLACWLLALLAAPAAAQTGAGPPPLGATRYDEDYSYLREPMERSGAWWEGLKLVPLGGDDVTLSTGAELQARYEGYANDLWGGGVAGFRDYTWLRALPYLDLRAGRCRAFAELICAFELDDEAGRSPIDEDRLDLLQAFAEVALPVDQATVTLRGGRQVLTYGSQRLIAARYGPNVLRAFDAGLVSLATAKSRVDLLYGQSVDPELGVFDDRASRTQAMWAAYATLPLGGPLGGPSVDAYYIGYENEQAAFNQGAGHETRHTLGTRFFGEEGAWDWNFELFGQGGRFQGGRIAAWSIASDSGYTLRDVPLAPRLGLKANLISGDDDPGDTSLGTFNPLFPNGKYFGEIGLLGPYNLINLHPSLDLALAEPWRLALGSVLYWRESTGDGIYDNGGNLLRGDGGSKARYIGTQLDAALSYAPHRTLQMTASYSTFFAGAFLADTGPDETVHFVSLEVRFIF